MHNSKNQNPSFPKLTVVLISALILAVFFILLIRSPWDGSDIQSEPGTVGYQENPWVLRKGDTILADNLHLPEYIRLDTGVLYTLSTVMTYDGSADHMPYGFIHLDHAFCRILLDGEVLFSCMPEDIEKWDASKSSGFIYKAFAVPEDCLGKTLEVQILPPLTVPIEYGLPEIEFGDLISTVRAAVVRDLPHDVVVVLCILLGIITILFSTTSLNNSDYREGISIGIFSLVFSLYLITECRLNAFYIGNPCYVYLLNYISFSLLPVSLMGFMRERLSKKHHRRFAVVITVELILFVIELILHFSGVLDMREFVSLIHLVYFSDVLLVILPIMTMTDKKKKSSLILQLLPMVLGMLADVLIYWLHWEVGGNDATFTILGVIIFLIVELFHVWRSSIVIYAESVRSKLYREMAYIDELTAIGNRRSYEEEIESLLSEKKTYQSLIIASADLNKLKYINDHFGHAAGDNVIRNIARIMKESVGSHGRVFRTGGDEFSVFLYDTDLAQCEEIIRTSKEKIDRFNAEHQFPMSLAVGYVQVQGNHILEAVMDADQKMYTDKARYNAENP